MTSMTDRKEHVRIYLSIPSTVPNTVIDGSIKVVGIPDFPWICDDELYQKLKKECH
jgi:hypothetical protein